jgi:hypothetical protein
MRKYFLAACLFLGIFAVMPPVFAQDAAGEAQIQAIVAQYPDGGPGLVAAITAAVETNPALAADVSFVAFNATPAQQEAMGTGLANAANYFADQHTPAGDLAYNEIMTAAANGPPTLIAAVDAAVEPTAGNGRNGNVPFGQLVSDSVHDQQQRCVSPSKPGPSC